jgi:hypothetical protein
VGEVVDGGAAGVDAHLARLQRDKFLAVPAKRIVKNDVSHSNSGVASATELIPFPVPILICSNREFSGEAF